MEPVKGDDTGPLNKFLGDVGTIGALLTTALLLGGKMTVLLSPLGSDKQSLLFSSFATNASTPENQTNWLLNPRRKLPSGGKFWLELVPLLLQTYVLAMNIDWSHKGFSSHQSPMSRSYPNELLLADFNV